LLQGPQDGRLLSLPGLDHVRDFFLVDYRCGHDDAQVGSCTTKLMYGVAEQGDETPVIVTRDKDGNIHAMVNRCAHKGALVCLKRRDNVANLACVYHAWNYELDGRLKSVAFRDGVRGQGGMPEDFDVRRHRLQPPKVEIFCGMIFGTFAEDMEDVQTYLGPDMAAFIKRNLALIEHGQRTLRFGDEELNVSKSSPV
jgi:hypothetical protein